MLRMSVIKEAIRCVGLREEDDGLGRPATYMNLVAICAGNWSRADCM